MTDPLEVLATPVAPVSPDPDFAATLRARIERALALPRGVAVSNVTVDDTESVRDAATDPILHGDIGFVSMWTPDVERAARFYTAVLGWEYGPAQHPDARHVTSSSMPQGLWGGHETSTLFCCFAVDDLDAALVAVRESGGTTEEPTQAPYGPTAMCTDDAGAAFAVYTPGPDDARPPANGRRHGDLAYVTFEAVDSARHRAFYGPVLGWQFEPGRVEDGWGPVDVQPMTGVSGGHARDVVLPMWLVDDITAAAERVRAAGGTSTEVQQQPYGLMTECADDQGGRFYLGQL